MEKNIITNTIELKPAVFFDRDGVLNHDIGYIHRIEDFSWIAGAKEAIKLCKSKGYLVFVVTNQSGVARGLYNEEDIHILHKHMQEELALINTAIDEFAYCPHHPDGIVEKYTIQCACRKPQGGMLLELINKYHVDKNQSFLIGDRESDLEAAKNAGITAYMFDSNNTLNFIKKIFQEN